jgi:hypothetical protein
LTTAADEYRAFIETVLGEMEGHAALALADEERSPTGRLQVNEYHWFNYPADLGEMVDFTVQRQDTDVYLLPSVYGDELVKIIRKGETITYPKDRFGRLQWSRGKSNALTSNTVYMDSDTCPPEAFRLPPSLHVETSAGHGHDYWILHEPIPAMQAADIAHKITAAHRAEGTDPTGWSANKVLRMPTMNTKNREDPWAITWADSGVRYDAEDVASAYADVEVAPQVKVTAAVTAAPTADKLLPFEDLVARIPATERRLADLLYKVPKRGETGWQSQQRWALIMDLLRFGFTPEETLSLVWHAPAGAKWHDDERSLDGLWSVEIQKAVAQLDLERGALASPAPAKPVRAKKICTLLTPNERARFERREDFITDYLAYARENVPVFNRPLHTINAMTILSIAFGEMAYIPKSSKPLPLNLYTMTLTGSSEGKSEAKGMMFGVINRLFPNDNPDIGGKHSGNALLEQLIERRNKVVFLHADEFHGRLAEIKQGGWQTGVLETWTLIYDGEIPSLGKTGRKDLQVQDAKTVPVFHAAGTLHGMLKVLDRPMFLSGYLARQIWVIGEKVELQPEHLMPQQILDDDPEKVYSRMPAYWASGFFRIRESLRAPSSRDSGRSRST